MAETMTPVQSLLEAVAGLARQSDAFGDVRITEGRLICEAKASDAPAEYRLLEDEGKVWVALATENRWLSESVESDLMHTGDKLEELLDEELADLDYDGPTPSYEHFRSERMEFTFRSPMPFAPSEADRPESIETARQYLLAYEATFAELGDMDTTGEDD
ncbi:MAG: hypothetical protein AAGK04_06805 [Planctomycetota bacterium]